MSAPVAAPPTRPVPERIMFPGTEVLDPYEIFSAPGYQAPRQRLDPLALAALATTLLCWIPGAGALGAGLGLAALRRLRSSYATGTTQAWAGVVVGGVSTVAWIWVMLLISLP